MGFHRFHLSVKSHDFSAAFNRDSQVPDTAAAADKAASSSNSSSSTSSSSSLGEVENWGMGIDGTLGKPAENLLLKHFHLRGWVCCKELLSEGSMSL